MKFMSFNIQHATDYIRQVIDLDYFAEEIKRLNPDFLGLNEVMNEGDDEEYTDQVGFFCEKLGWNGFFGLGDMIDGNNPFGNAIITKYPIKEVENFPIPDPEDKSEPAYYESRCVIRAIVEVDGTDVCWLVCHMGLAKLERENAVKVISLLIDSTDLPVILMGDFNVEPDGEVLLPIRERLLDTADLFDSMKECTFPSDKPFKKIDYIFYRGLECVSAETLHEVIADHLPVVADFKPLKKPEFHII
ncbi:MAG: endonuclease/exonuclease/phosphatase family protein [Clostridia bacterium]|nr:endonuclease/exonuclease/phosphatase family protein [Clostridia bacterium]